MAGEQGGYNSLSRGYKWTERTRGLIALILSSHPNGASLDVQAVKALRTAGAPMIMDHPLAWVFPACNESAPAPVVPAPVPGPKGPSPNPATMTWTPSPPGSRSRGGAKRSRPATDGCRVVKRRVASEADGDVAT